MANFKLNQTGEQIQADLNLLDSNNATQGQVLTANGTGGASWQNANGGGGGGTQLYKHEIEIGNNESLNATIIVINESNLQFSSVSDVLKYCGNISMQMIQATFEPDPGHPEVITRYNLIITKDFVLYANSSSDAPSNISVGDIDTNYFIPMGIFIISDTVTPL